MATGLGRKAKIITAYVGIVLFNGNGIMPAKAQNHGPTAPSLCDGTDNKRVLAALTSAGANLTLPRELDFYFYGPAERLSPMQDRLVELGFSVRATKVDTGLMASIVTVANERWFSSMTPQLCELAEKNAITYDGWEASLPERHKP